MLKKLILQCICLFLFLLNNSGKVQLSHFSDEIAWHIFARLLLFTLCAKKWYAKTKLD